MRKLLAPPYDASGHAKRILHTAVDHAQDVLLHNTRSLSWHLRTIRFRAIVGLRATAHPPMRVMFPAQATSAPDLNGSRVSRILWTSLHRIEGRHGVCIERCSHSIQSEMTKKQNSARQSYDITKCPVDKKEVNQSILNYLPSRPATSHT